MSFDTDVVINKSYPAVEYMPIPPPPESGTYFEDREVDGVMYRTQNATNPDGTGWSQVDMDKNSYATTQNTDGSISNFTVPAGTSGSWTAWGGNGIRQVFNVLDFGAMGDGVNDDAPAIALANAAAVQAKGGYIYLPVGTYLISEVLLLGSSESGIDYPITIGGDGKALTTIFAGAGINGHANTLMVANAQWGTLSTTPVQSNIYVENLGFDGNAAHNAASATLGLVYLKLVQNCGVTNCSLVNSVKSGILISGDETHADWPVSYQINFRIIDNDINLNAGTSQWPIRVEGANLGLIQGNTIGVESATATVGAGIYCPGSSDVEVCDNFVSMCGDGISANASNDVIISNNRIVDPAGFGITTASSTEGGSGGVSNLTITGNTVLNSENSGIRISCPSGSETKGFAVSGNVVTLSSSSSGAYGIHIEASQGSVAGNAIGLNNATESTGIVIDSGQSGGNNYITITGNTINFGTAGIIFVRSGSSVTNYCTITDNNISIVTTPLSTNFGPLGMGNSAIRNNPGINPWLSATSTPSFPASTSPQHNTYPFDIWVTVIGGTVSKVRINGNESGVKDGSILLPGGTDNYITIEWSGSTAPTWMWLAY